MMYCEPPSLYELPPIEVESPVKSNPAPAALAAMYDMPPTSSSYQSALYDVPPVPPPLSEKYKQLAKELLQTEERYLGDLVLAKKLFYLNLITVVDKRQLEQIFLNWDELIDLSKRTLARFKRGDSIGSVFLAEIGAMSAFVTFCKGQQAAVEAIPTVLGSPDARQIYAQCCASQHARGMSLNTFILLPLGRVTRYPLLVEKMLKECGESSTEHQDLDAALQLLRALVAEVNRAVSEMDTLALLCWAQQHVKCPNIQPPIEFTSPTRNLGSRTFFHSGTIYKARSGKLLVGMLFNDFLLLATPDETISEPDSFKVTKSTDVKLTMYKQPYLVEKLRIETSKEPDNLITLVYGEGGNEVVNLRCNSNNAAKLWTNQIQQAIDLCGIAMAESNQSRQPIPDPKGRLLVEIVNILNITPKIAGSGPHVIKLTLGKMEKSSKVDIAKNDLNISTQFQFLSTDLNFTLALYQKRTYSPDILVLEKTSVTLKELIDQSSKHRGPLSKAMNLRKKSTSSKNQECVVVKFVVQLFESEI